MFEPLTQQFFGGRYYAKRPTIENREEGIYFRYEKLIEKSKRFSQPINNLITKEGRYTISTTFDIHFVPGGYVLDQDGHMYIISETANGDDLNEQRSFFFVSNKHFTVLSLTECANPLQLEV